VVHCKAGKGIIKFNGAYHGGSGARDGREKHRQ